MSNIVENNVKPSGGLVLPSTGLLSGIPSQPTAPPAPQPQPLVDVVTASLSAAGADADTILDARQTVAAGHTWLHFAQAVRDQNNEDLLPVVDCLAEIIERVAGHQSLKPLLSAIERFKAEESDRNWMSLRAGDVRTMPLPSLLDAFGAVVVEVDEVENGGAAILHQEDEQLEMWVLRSLTRKQREAAIRAVFLRFAGLNR
ncbi:hypothetical protein [Streptomyces sp. NPDC005283]|uniref:hypothetical protein n=1 Tax=Streptomyces sp. NPDC005283 TaxID=3156871 RepID=UPI003452E203